MHRDGQDNTKREDDHAGDEEGKGIDRVKPVGEFGPTNISGHI